MWETRWMKITVNMKKSELSQNGFHWNGECTHKSLFLLYVFGCGFLCMECLHRIAIDFISFQYSNDCSLNGSQDLWYCLTTSLSKLVLPTLTDNDFPKCQAEFFLITYYIIILPGYPRNIKLETFCMLRWCTPCELQLYFSIGSFYSFAFATWEQLQCVFLCATQAEHEIISPHCGFSQFIHMIM